MARWLVGIDTGGTFTDLIYIDDEAGRILVHKLATTPDDPSEGTVRGIRELTEQAGVSPSALDQVFQVGTPAPGTWRNLISVPDQA